MLYQTIEIEVPTEAYQGRPKEFECMGERGEMIMTVVLCDYGTHVQARIGCSPSHFHRQRRECIFLTPI
jgi:hypothetical protein